MISQIRFIACGAVLFQALVAFPAHAFVADAARGEVIANRWCAACHLVSPGSDDGQFGRSELRFHRPQEKTNGGRISDLPEFFAPKNARYEPDAQRDR
jgi:hypothetical protein